MDQWRKDQQVAGHVAVVELLQLVGPSVLGTMRVCTDQSAYVGSSYGLACSTLAA